MLQVLHLGNQEKSEIIGIVQNFQAIVLIYLREPMGGKTQKCLRRVFDSVMSNARPVVMEIVVYSK